MSKRKWLFAGAFLVILLLCANFVSLWLYSIVAKPVFRLVSDVKGNPVDRISQTPIPNKGYLHAAVAVDKLGNFYLLSSKRNEFAPIPGVPSSVEPEREQEYVVAQQRIIYVLVVNAEGQIQQAVPLRRLDGRLVRGGCDFLVVNKSGERWWTLRQAHESLEDWKDRDEVEQRTVLLNTYDNQGKCLGEWKVPMGLAGETFAMAAIGTEVYIAPENLEQEKQLLTYSVGSTQSEQRPWPGSWIPMISGSFITSDGQFWHLLPSNSGNVQAFVTHLKKPSVLFTTFQWQPQGFTPFLFWADDEIGLFVFKHLYEHAPTSTPPRRIRSDGAKAVYHVAPDGTVQKLFETPDILQQRFGYQVRTGQPLKADANYIWLEAEYLKNGKVTEYQIVKVKYR
jgi:hypothetical protein